MQKIENPAGGGGASGSVHVDELNDQKSTLGTEKTQALTPIQQRILMLSPSADVATLEVRGKLMTARDYALTRMADWIDWPERAHSLHAIAILWSGRASLAPWPPEDLERVVEMVRHLIVAANIMRDLGDRHGDI